MVRPVDRWQQSNGPIGFLYGVVKKFGDDRGGTLAAVVTFYGFLSLFPLLLLALTVTAFVVGSRSGDYASFRNAVLQHFPVLGKQLPIKPLSKSGFGLAVGVIGLAWGSLGIAQAIQYAINEAWGVPAKDRPSFLPRIARSLGFIALLGLWAVLGQGLNLLGSIVGRSYLVGALGVVAALVVNVCLFLGVFTLLGPRDVRWRDNLPGAVIAGVAWQVLQIIGQQLVLHDVKNMAPAYGQFAVVLGFISFLSLATQASMYAVEVNVVRARRLWPRSMVQSPLTDADRRSLDLRALEQESHPEQEVSVSWEGADQASS